MNKLLFLLVWAAMAAALFFPLRKFVDPSDPKGARERNNVILLGPVSFTDFSTNVTRSFEAPWDLSLVLVAKTPLPKEGTLSVRALDGSGNLCLAREANLADLPASSLFKGNFSVALPFTFIVKNEEELKNLDLENGPFFSAEGESGLLPNTLYNWEINLNSEEANSALLFLTFQEKVLKNRFLERYLETLALVLAILLALLPLTIIWLWHAGSLYGVVKKGLLLILVLAFTCEVFGETPTFVTPISELKETLPLFGEFENGLLFRLEGSLLFARGNERLVICDGAQKNSFTPEGELFPSSGFLGALTKGETFRHQRDLGARTDLKNISLGERSLLELTRHLGPPELTGTGAFLFSAWSFKDGGSLFAACEGDQCLRLEFLEKNPEYYLDQKVYGKVIPEWAKYRWRYLHLGAALVLVLISLAIMVRAILYAHGANRLLRDAALKKAENEKS